VLDILGESNNRFKISLKQKSILHKDDIFRPNPKSKKLLKFYLKTDHMLFELT